MSDDVQEENDVGLSPPASPQQEALGFVLDPFKESIFNRIFMSYMSPLFRMGVERALSERDIGLLSEEYRVERVYKIFAAAWKEELALGKVDKSKVSLWRALIKTSGYKAQFVGLIWSAIGAASAFGPPLILKALTFHFSGVDVLSKKMVWILTSLLFFVPFLGVIFVSLSQTVFGYTSVVFKNALTPAIYRKTLILSSGARATNSGGQIINLFTNDIRNIVDLTQQFADPLFSPMQLIVTLALIYQEIGVAMFSGFGLVIAILPAMIGLFVFFAKYKAAKSKFSDVRIKLTKELFDGIRILKSYAWEVAFGEEIEKVRQDEIVWLGHSNYLIVFILMFIIAIPFVMPIVMFYAHIAQGKQLGAGKSFTILALVGLLQNPIIMIPGLAQRYFSASVSIQRLTDFFLSDELQNYVKHVGEPLGTDNAIVVVNATVSWPSAMKSPEVDAGSKATSDAPPSDLKADSKGAYETISSKESEGVGGGSGDIELSSGVGGSSNSIENNNAERCVLSNMSFSIKRGEVVGVVGTVGVGKTSLLSCLLGDIKLMQGEVYLRGSVAYHSQQAWILNATIRDNILFGSAYNEEKFNSALDAASLWPDIAILKNGLETEIGERGINLSGGQKARVSFARAVYRNADLYLLDDPLSAVDAHVGEHIFHKGIRQVLNGKTVFLVTHQVQFLDHCDKLLVLSEGKIKAFGTPLEVKEAGVDVHNLLLPKAQTIAGEVVVKSASDSAVASVGAKVVVEEPAATRAVETTSSKKNDNKKIEIKANTDAMASNKGKIEGKDALMTIEEKASGAVPLDVYMWYGRAGGISWAFWSCILSAGGNAAYAYSSFWLADWGKESTIDQIMASYGLGEPMTLKRNTYYLNIYALLVTMNCLTATLRTAVLVRHGLVASDFIHKKLLSRIMNSPVAFFDTTPLGRILNRLSVDLVTMDDNLSYMFGFSVGIVFAVLAIIGSIAYTTKGSFLVLLVPLGFFLHRVQLYYRRTNTELKRLDSVTKSPVLSEFTQVLNGAVSIRAFGESQQFITRMETITDVNSSYIALNVLTQWWLNIRLDSIGGIVSFFIAALCAGKPDFIPAGYLGLSLMNSIAMVGSLKYLVNNSAQVETAMNNAERVKNYVDHLDEEEPEEVRRNYLSESEIPSDWPQTGAIEAVDIKMRYRSGPLVLKGIDFDIKSKEKIGIAGRTGCGKSSIMVALFRMERLALDKDTDPSERSKSIYIDGIDINRVPLKVLRSRIGIIPQDAMMFSNTIRFNIDPFSKHSDDEIWGALDSVNMKETIQALPMGLLDKVAEGGENFSAGQRQLVCIARVLLRNPKILVMDEATASVDNETDKLVQEMVRDKFKNCTTLTIAHRLHTIMDSDRIMVLKEGKIAEFDKPDVLTSKADGMLTAMVQSHSTYDESKK